MLSSPIQHPASPAVRGAAPCGDCCHQSPGSCSASSPQPLPKCSPQKLCCKWMGGQTPRQSHALQPCLSSQPLLHSWSQQERPQRRAPGCETLQEQPQEPSLPLPPDVQTRGWGGAVGGDGQWKEQGTEEGEVLQPPLRTHPFK